jgi:murein DD-endopeptidase MepM/ murein hydrolase activator NlpD
MSYKKAVSALFLALTVAGCASAPTVKSPRADNPPKKTCEGVYHTVTKGETLWRISKNYGVELDKVVEANGLSDAGEIKTGQVILIPKKPARPEAKKAEPPMAVFPHEEFAWPVQGRIVVKFGDRKGLTPSKGIDISAKEGSAVIASRSGRVIFCEEKVKGFGKTVIVDHGDGMQTVYSHNSEILVKTGQDVKRLQSIAKVGSGGRDSTAYLHFEIRKKHKPQNPVHYLP